ncbi:hypothetical protein PPYR_00885 [Photinus pyralis]|uniref:Guanine nucleotide-binding protein G(s) subunit alpha n=1 Tax=Photinus pyralis TaxID=7054 RepID=A0A5N4B2W5_PHOPY|nr:guanine nucleotide-binding protein G(f) subunit alpha-like [Photinus pyralis]KAB0803915.1 hypothetical protein PPYR_00885 [Photinus pyralis]
MLCRKKKINEETKRSNVIDNALKSEKKKLDRIQRILLLGTGEAGKTTIIKQMKIIHINGFSEQEKRDKVANIKQNIHESIYALIYNMSKIDPRTSLEAKNCALGEYILQIGEATPREFTDEYYNTVTALWADSGVKNTFQRSNEFQLIDSAAHFLDRIDSIRDPNYVPTVQDMLYCRTRTVAISKIEFTIPYKGQNVDFCMYDVGGQRGERKKWISVFEGIGAILFLIAASDFDQTLREDGVTNRLNEGFKVFKDIFWSRFVRNAGKIVFLNKQDILKAKVESGKQLENYFPEFANYEKAEPNQYHRAKFFIRDQVLKIASRPPKPEMVDFFPDVEIKQNVKSELLFVHFTVATDTSNVKLVFNDIKDIIIAINLGNSGLI